MELFSRNPPKGKKKKNSFYDKKKKTSTHRFVLLPTLLHPLSRGKIQLSSNNPLHPPVIDLAYLTHPRDLEVLVNSCTAVRHVAATGFEKGFVVKEIQDPQVNVPVNDFSYLEKHIKHSLMTVYHPVIKNFFAKNFL